MHQIQAWLFILERILPLQADQITAIAQRDHSTNGKLSAQRRKELCARPGFSYNERTCGPHIHDVVSAEFPGEDTWAEYPVPANVYSPEENDQSHLRR